MFLAPPLRPDADRPCALWLAKAVSAVELKYLGILAQAGRKTDLANDGQHIVHLACSTVLFWDVVHIDAAY